MKKMIFSVGFALAIVAITAFGAGQKYNLPRNGQDDGQVLL
jgi:hypothetical protein